MKKILISLLSGLLLMGFVSCQSWLDETKYTYRISTTSFYNTVNEANSAVIAVLDQMRSAHNSNWFASLEINTEHIYPKGVYQASGNYAGITNNTHLNRCGSNFQNLYRAYVPGDFCQPDFRHYHR